MRRNIGRQPLQPRRVTFRLTILCLVSIVTTAVLAHFAPHAAVGLAGGILTGGLLGFLGWRLTRFETTEEGHFYIPDTRMGVAISLIVVIRILYRMIVPPDFSLVPGHTPQPISPLTFFLVGISLGYFIVYLTGLLIHAHDKYRQQAALPPKL